MSLSTKTKVAQHVLTLSYFNPSNSFSKVLGDTMSPLVSKQCSGCTWEPKKMIPYFMVIIGGQSLLSLHMKTKVFVTETVTDTFGSQLLSKTFDIFIMKTCFKHHETS